MNAKRSSVVGILYCGDLGSAVARLLRRSGVRVVTTCADRSGRTRERAAECDIEILSSLDDVVRESDLVISLVLPTAAIDVARQFADRSHLCPESTVFVDANSTGLEVVSEIEQMLVGQNIDFVDATIHGGAARLEQIGVMYVSGRTANKVETIFRNILQVRWLGDQIGMATRMKLLLAGFSKSLNALFLEIVGLSHNAGMMEQFLEGCRHFYPGVMTAIERMLPTYPQHAARRVGELQYIQSLADTCQARHGMIDAAAELLQMLSVVKWDGQRLSATPADIPEIVRQAAQACHPQTQPVAANEVSA